VALIEQKIATRVPPDKPVLRLVDGVVAESSSALDAATRASHAKMIRHLAKRYRLHILVDQATFGKGAVDKLPDDELVALHRELQRALECIADGISLEDAGFIRCRQPRGES
jgi:hypothetical protein